MAWVQILKRNKLGYKGRAGNLLCEVSYGLGHRRVQSNPSAGQLWIWSIRVAGKNTRPFFLSRLSSRGDLGILSYVLSLPFGSSACPAWCSNQAASELDRYDTSPRQVWMTTRARLPAIAGAVLTGCTRGWRSPVAFRLSHPVGVKMSQNVSTASLTAGAITPVPVDTCLGVVVGYSMSFPEKCCSCTTFCVLLKDDFRLSNPESAQCELDGRICQQVH